MTWIIKVEEEVPPEEEVLPEEKEKIPVWVWIAAVLGGAYLLLSRRGEE